MGRANTERADVHRAVILSRALQKNMETGTVYHPICARLFVRMAGFDHDSAAARRRREALSGLSGRVIEVGAGHGLNFPYYPATVTQLVALEPEPYLRRRAARAAGEAQIPVTVVDGIAERIPVMAGSFDAAVVSLVLCTVRDQRKALSELSRVLRTGGELRFYEHVRSSRPLFSRLQRAADALGWTWVSGGCHVSRDTVSAIEDAGFTVEALHEHRFRPFLLDYLSDPLVIGVARKTVARGAPRPGRRA